MKRCGRDVRKALPSRRDKRLWPLNEPPRRSSQPRVSPRLASGRSKATLRRHLRSSPDNTAKVWNAKTGQQLVAALQHRGRVTAVAWSPDGNRVATASSDGTA